MDPNLKSLVHTLVFAVLFLILFVMLLPPLLHVLNRPEGRAVYGVFVAGAVAIAFRLRVLTRRL